MKTVRTAVQAAQAAINGVRSKGPKTPEGKVASSLNALRHGLSAKQLLLPGEDADEYERHLDGYFVTFAPATLPEAVIVAQIGDTAWKLERLSKLESGRTLASLEDALEKTLEFERFALTRRALRAVNALVEIADACPVPQDAAQTDALLAAVDGTMKIVHEVPELPMMVSRSLAFSLGHARDTSKDGRMLPDAYRALGDAAKVLKGALSAKLAEDEGALAPVRERLAAEVLLLDDADLRKLERHRKLLETAMQRQLGLLDQLRVQVAAVKTQNPAESKELRVRLRLVK
ncbi:hypothetical protein JRI60_09090 [Archangium violaceum]|uniref:hypothetical protein n=1 Tax=Archangium violaceum TaxID=83451 RepID=UPI00194DD04F|nr:hypothetical protein [Archangium violaceum]QRN99152.1 hypothetical protein JRI60_09090 [Archangium violaceum]